MFVDLDRLKDLNDCSGHAAGDELLRIVGERLRATVRGEDLVGRVGGDEFLVMCPQVGGADGAMSLAERLAQSLREPAALAAGSVSPQVEYRCGVVEGDAIPRTRSWRKADAAMYQSKRKGEGRPELVWGPAEAVPLTSPVELLRGASGDRSLPSSSERARRLRSA